MSDPIGALALRLAALAAVVALLVVVRVVILTVNARRRLRVLTSQPIAEFAVGRRTVLLFSGTLCSDCVKQREILEAVQREAPDGWSVHEVQAARELHLARQFGVESVPATVVMDARGRPRAVNYGLVEASVLREQLAAG